MKIMLTSFGVTPTYKRPVGYKPLFNRMPPVDMNSIGKKFMPDYAALLLCDRIIVDKFSFDILTNEPPVEYSDFARTILLLHDEGFIELVDYADILENNRSILDKMLEHDTRHLNQWFKPFTESVKIWRKFVSNVQGNLNINEDKNLRNQLLHGDLHADDLLFLHDEIQCLIDHKESSTSFAIDKGNKISRKPRKSHQLELRDAFNAGIRGYLYLVNSNIVISNTLGVGFYDWSDFAPFYTHKFLSVGKGMELSEKTESMRKLFTISFPELAIQEPRSLIRLLKDKRIRDLRQFIDDSIERGVEFDNKFAKETLFNVISTNQKINRYRNIVSYITILLGFIPGVSDLIQTGLEELAGSLIDRKLNQKYRWFYMLNDINSSQRAKSSQ